jgi:hypothetical protein
MPLSKGKTQKAISMNIRELVADNKKKGKEKGAGGKARPMKQIVAIALTMAGKSKKQMKKGKK